MMFRFLNNRYLFDGRSGRFLLLDEGYLSQVRAHVERYGNDYQELDFDGLITYASQRDENISPADDTQEHHLKHVVVVITEQCNLRCSYCPYPFDTNRRHHPHGEFHSKSELNRIVTALSDRLHKQTTLSFYGGEPLFRLSDIKYVVDSLRINRPEWTGRFSLTTNLTILPNSAVDFLIDYSVPFLVSLDGPKDIHDRHRKKASGQGSYDLVVRNLGRLRSRDFNYYKSHIGINAVICSDAFDSINDYFKKQFLDLALVRFSVAKSFVMGNTQDITSHDLKESLEHWATAKLSTMATVMDIAQEPLLLDFMRKNILPIISRSNVCNNRKKFTSCAPGQRIIINRDGSVGVCEKAENLRLGSLSTSISTGTEIADKFANMLVERCRYCFAASMCSICYATVYEAGQLSRRELDQYCISFRACSERMLQLYADCRDKFANFDRDIKGVAGEAIEQFE